MSEEQRERTIREHIDNSGNYIICYSAVFKTKKRQHLSTFRNVMTSKYYIWMNSYLRIADIAVLTKLIKSVCATGVTLLGSGCWSGWCLPPCSCLQWDRTEQEDPVRGESGHPTLTLCLPLCCLISSIEECVKACPCLWCSIKQLNVPHNLI